MKNLIFVDGLSAQTVDAACVTNTVAYDAFRRRVSETDGRGNTTTFTYDAHGRLIAQTDAATNTTCYAYDAMDRVTAITNALGGVTTRTYDTRGNLLSEGGATYPVNYGYNVFGERTSLTTFRDESTGIGDTTTWLYDEASGLVTNKVYADGIGPTYSYDANGRLARRVWARGVVTTYTYDVWGALMRMDYSDDTPSVVLAYDAMGRQTSALDAAGTTTFAYDAFGVNTNEIVVGVAGTNTIERFTDAFGRDAGYALNGTRQSTLGYDSVTGRLATMLLAGSETPFTWGYLVGTDIKSSLVYPNGLTALWTYDNRNQLLEVHNAFQTNVLSQYAYTYDVAGRRIGCDMSGSAFAAEDTLAYRYNARSEITNATASVDATYRYGYAFDDVGNRVVVSERGADTLYCANLLNQYTNIVEGVDAFVPQYDADGNETLVKTATGTWQVTYNGENRPVLWRQGKTSIAMTYDRMGRRVTKEDERFVYDGYLQIADNAGNSYFWDPTERVATRPLAWLRNTGAAYYTHDGNKNVSEIIAADGSGIAHYEYAPFGAITDNTFSFGPIPRHNSYKSLFWGVPGGYWDVVAYKDLQKFVVSKKCWSQTADECARIKSDISKSYPDEFSLFDYCTSAAVRFLHQHGIDTPSGCGEIDMPWWFPNVRRANPKDMYEQIISNGGHAVGGDEESL